MRTTLVLEVSDEMYDFIQNQQGLIDPSAFVNKIIHEKARQQGNAASERTPQDGDKQALEEFIDQQIPSAG